MRLTVDGLSIMMVNRSGHTANTPRAHITNLAALECLRDIGLEDECMKQASPENGMKYAWWCQSMLGQEYARTFSLGSDPERKVISS
jgi:hypothetical protein